MAFGICVKDAEEAIGAVEGLDCLSVMYEFIHGIPRCRFADSKDSFITLLPARGELSAFDLDVGFGKLEAIVKDDRRMAQWRTCLERLDVPFIPPVLYISP